MIVERLQKELNMVPVVDTNWPYLTGRKRREVVKPTSLVDEDILSEEVAIEENSLECYMDEVTRSAVNSVCCYSSDQLCDEPQEDYSAMEYEVCCEIPTVDTSQDISQDTNQDIIQHSSQNIYINHDNSSQDIVQDTTVEEVIQSEMSEQEMEGSIKELLVKGVSVVRCVVMVMMMSCVSFPGKNHYRKLERNVSRTLHSFLSFTSIGHCTYSDQLCDDNQSYTTTTTDCHCTTM